MVLFGIPGRRRACRVLLTALSIIAVTSGIIACGGVGGSGEGHIQPNPGTTPGAYTITVNASDAATGKITASINVALTVN